MVICLCVPDMLRRSTSILSEVSVGDNVPRMLVDVMETACPLLSQLKTTENNREQSWFTEAVQFRFGGVSIQPWTAPAEAGRGRGGGSCSGKFGVTFLDGEQTAGSSIDPSILAGPQ